MSPDGTHASLRIHSRLANSRANGPGARAVVWVQGCDLGCPGCYNPETHVGDAGQIESVPTLLDWLANLGGTIEGISVSGGEPLQQPAGLLAFLTGLRERLPALSVLVFSGYRLEEIERQPHGPALLSLIDVLIDGRYNQTQHRGEKLQGSANQAIHCLTDRYQRADVEATPATEVTIGVDGSLILTGVSPFETD